MAYLSFDSEADALRRSSQEARARGCDMVGTTHWWPTETNGRNACLVIPEGDEGSLSADERAALAADPPRWLTELRAASAVASRAATAPKAG